MTYIPWSKWINNNILLYIISHLIFCFTQKYITLLKLKRMWITEQSNILNITMQDQHLVLFGKQCKTFLYIYMYVYVCMYVCMYISGDKKNALQIYFIDITKAVLLQV